jgi:hypothetical protein
MRKPDRQITESDQPFVHLTNENFSLEIRKNGNYFCDKIMLNILNWP